MQRSTRVYLQADGSKLQITISDKCQWQPRIKIHQYYPCQPSAKSTPRPWKRRSSQAGHSAPSTCTHLTSKKQASRTYKPHMSMCQSDNGHKTKNKDH